MVKPKIKYTQNELRELSDILRKSSNNLCNSFGIVLCSLLDKEFSFTVEPTHVGSIQGHKFLYDNYSYRYSVLFLRELSMLPTEMNDEDPVVNEIVLWRIKNGKGE